MSRSTQPSQEDRNEPGTTVLESVWGSLSILTKPLKLERSDDGKVRVVVDDPAATRRKAQVIAAAEQSLSRMQSELTELLDRSKGSRKVMPHLASLEHGLKSRGLDAFDTVPERAAAPGAPRGSTIRLAMSCVNNAFADPAAGVCAAEGCGAATSMARMAPQASPEVFRLTRVPIDMRFTPLGNVLG